MAEVAVLFGGPRDGQELPLRDRAPGPRPTVLVPSPAVLSPALTSDPPTAADVLPPHGVYAAPWVDGGWSRDDAGRLRLTWRGWGRG